MNEIRNWPEFGDTMPYASWFSCSTTDWKFIPLVDPCELHAKGFDCYLHDCGCKEFKFVKRSKEEIEEIRKLQKISCESDTLKRAATILAKRGISAQMLEVGSSLLEEHQERPYTTSAIMASTIFMEMLSKMDL